MANLKLGRMLRRAFLELGLFSAIVNLLLLAMPLYMLQVYDRVIPSANLNTLGYITLIAVGALAVLGVLESVRSLYASQVAVRIDLAWGPRLFLAAMQGPKAGLGDVQPLRDLALVRNFISSRAVFFLFDLPFAPVFVLLLYFVHPVLFAMTVVGAFLMLAVAFANQAATRAKARQASDALSAATNVAQVFARNFETVRALGMASNAVEQWGARFADSVRVYDRLAATNAFFGSAARTVRLLLQIATYGIGAYLALQGEMTAGMIFAASMMSARGLQPLDQIVGSWRQIWEANAAWRRISAVSGLETGAQTARTELPAPQGAVKVEEVVYFPPDSREGAQPLIKRVNFGVAAGETLAIVGPSRAGKSTLARLLVGAIEPRSGVVRFDGADIRNWDPDQLGLHVGYLPQDVELFPGTIADNIARFVPGASSLSVIDAAERALVHQMVLAQKDGYDTVIGPLGVRLSGGERQRIGLARAFYGDPRLIVLDEPNANLDADGEKALEHAVLQAKARGATVIVITHRPTIAARCDRILMLRDGQIELLGPAQDVIRRLSLPLAAAQPDNPAPAREPVASVVPIKAAQGAAWTAAVSLSQPGAE
ncbi:type I secretion system permease/ATPase [Consotaella aegiceratis]|uniref:type I secretion system permease/ATPase n=1 Tax=Consotaella aegiceratis TaxID=3097961 RepID=UPI002F3F9C9C